MKRNKEFFQTLTNDFLSPCSSAKTKTKTCLEQQTFTFELNASLSNSIEHVDCTTMVDRLSVPSSPSNSSSASSSSSPTFKQQYSKLSSPTPMKPKLTHCLSSSPLLSPYSTLRKKSTNSSDWKWKSEDGIRKKKKSRKDSWVQMAKVVLPDESSLSPTSTYSSPTLPKQSTLPTNNVNNNNTKPEETTHTNMSSLPNTSNKQRIVRTSIKISELLN